ncbi:DnaJ domain-containing protein [Stieleria marina]|uniref:DnaJ-like protein n=1 Tax=Stieleria marina TaxID=1930275 RepID=A0A517NRI6_9BACT|nr:DnaJ-like protein [Planctomycetes bacterium K23_9]
MTIRDFVDYYEVLEISPNASEATIERVFRYLAKKNHPDASPSADVGVFTRMVEAFETLRDPKARAAYDIEHERQQQAKGEIVEGANAASDDCMVRYKVLTILYSQRRRDYKKPGIGIGTLEDLAPCPPEVLQFHLWYFREKGWMAREQSGQIAITAAGIDHVESMNQPSASNQLKLENRSARMTAPTPV